MKRALAEILAAVVIFLACVALVSGLGFERVTAERDAWKARYTETAEALKDCQRGMR